MPRDKGPRAGRGRVEAKRRNASEEARDGKIMPLLSRGNLVGIYSRGKRGFVRGCPVIGARPRCMAMAGGGPCLDATTAEAKPRKQRRLLGDGMGMKQRVIMLLMMMI